MHKRSFSVGLSPDNIRPSILYVDDCHLMLELMKILLEKKNQIDVQTCISPKKALILLKEYNPAIILSDYEMPGMNGVELLGTIRSKGINVPFILYTSYTQKDIDESVFGLEMVFYVQKAGLIEEEMNQILTIIRNFSIHQRKQKYPDVTILFFFR